MYRLRDLLLVVMLLAAAGGAVGSDSTWPAAAAVFESRCLSCHNDADRKGGLSLSSAASWAVGGDSGPAVTAGRPDNSLLLELISGIEPAMPQMGRPLSVAEVDALRRWIAAGASWPAGATLRDRSLADGDWWSLRPLVRPAVPVLAERDARRVQTPVDAFVLAKLGELGLSQSPQADRRTLVRRLYFDLLGLPPSPEEVDTFVGDPHPEAYDQLVERLLGSPHYGERWARHWLDVVHYGDTHGYDKDKPRPNAWPYRDYVIRAFNDDKPYTRFVWEQLAGDVLWPDSREELVATGFMAAGPWDFIGHAEVPETKIDGKVARHLDRDDMVATTMNAFLSLTVQCAQCHNHKFDPVGQEHYYSLQAVFAALDRADRAFEPDAEVGRRRRELRDRKQKLTAERQASERQVNDGPATERKVRSAGGSELEAIDRQLAELPPPEMYYCGCVHHGSGSFLGTGQTGGKPREIHILLRGNVQQPGEPVGPGAVPIIKGVDWRFSLPSGHAEGERRAALARWITHHDNPLTWRSIVNRVWQYHFGRGLVDSPNDFGRMGQLPTHPELLDWLAAEFRDGRQSIKDLHRVMVRSATYRQVASDGGFAVEPDAQVVAPRRPDIALDAVALDATAINPAAINPAAINPAAIDAMGIDAENQFLWRMNRRKLEAEAVRDAVLVAAGKLDRTMYGPAYQDFVIDRPEHSPHYEYHKHDPDDPKSHRRSVYRFLVRSQPQPFMSTLDCADPSQLVDKRSETVTALQALALLNNRFMIRMSEHFARRLETRSADVDRQIEFAFQLALGRLPTPVERSDVVAFVREHGLASACRVVLNLNEFAFVD